MNTALTVTKRTRVFKDIAGRNAAKLGEKGFATQYIMDCTGLSAGQVSYRLLIAGVSRADYRNGKTPMARKAVKLGISGRLAHKLDTFTKEFDAYENRIRSVMAKKGRNK